MTGLVSDWSSFLNAEPEALYKYSGRAAVVRKRSSVAGWQQECITREALYWALNQPNQILGSNPPPTGTVGGE